jgi:hypothetical protein
LLIACGVLYLFGENFANHLRNNRPNATVSLVLAIVLRATMSALAIAYGITTIWWGRAVQLCEHGTLHGLRLLQWDHVTSCHWSRWTSSVLLEGVDQRHRDYQVGISISRGKMDTVGAIFAEKFPALFDEQQIHALSYRSARQFPFPMVTGGEQLSRGCLVFLVAWIGGITFASIVGRIQTREFGNGWIAGAIASIATAYLSSRKTAQAGRPLLRLNLWFDWPALVGWAAVAGLCYASGRWLGFISTWVSAPLGMACGYAFVSAVRMMALNKLDLCEKGIVAGRAWFWPWQGTRARFVRTPLPGPVGDRERSNAIASSRIEFRRGWQRVAAIVPSTQREAVQTLLDEKLAQE